MSERNFKKSAISQITAHKDFPMRSDQLKNAIFPKEFFNRSSGFWKTQQDR